MKRVLVLSSVHPIGHPRYGNKLVKSLGNNGYDVEVWAQDRGSLKVSDNVNLVLFSPKCKLSRFFQLPKMLWKILTNRYDLIVVVPPETIPLGLIAKLFGKKVLWDVEEDAYSSIKHSDWIPAKISAIVAKVYDLFERTASICFDGITLAEDSYKGRFRKAKRVIVTHNYPPIPNNEHQDLSRGKIAEARWALPGPRLIYIGTMTEPRGLYHILKVIQKLEEKLPDLRLDVLGDIPSSTYKEKVEHLISQFKNPERVTLHGRVPFDYLNDYMKKAHFGVLPLHPTPNFVRSEPTKVFEYSLAGLPTISGDVPVWKTIIKKTGVGEVARPLNEQEWADAIFRLWTSGPEKLRKDGEIVHDFIFENNLFWDYEAKKLIALCDEIMSK